MSASATLDDWRFAELRVLGRRLFEAADLAAAEAIGAAIAEEIAAGEVMRRLTGERTGGIETAAQEPAPAPLPKLESDRRTADVEGRPVGVGLLSPEPSSEGGQILGTAGSLAPCISSTPDGGGWRAARRALRQAGHFVEQVAGVVYVDGRPCADPALQAR